MPRKKSLVGPTSPSAYAVTSLRSSFGKQCQSGVASSPGASFGSARRDDFDRTYAGRDADRARLWSAGAGSRLGYNYKTYSSFGQNCDSRKMSGTNTKFGTGTRDVQSARSHRQTPGPGTYKVTMQSMGSQLTTKYRNSPKAAFGTATRDAEAKVFLSEEHAVAAGASSRRRTPGPGHYSARSSASTPSWKVGTDRRFKTELRSIIDNTPAPGQYATASSMGKQSLARRKNAPTAGFGTATRDGRTAVYISAEHEKSASAPWGPGPTTSLQHSSFSKQKVSQNKTNPAYGFGTAKRGQRQGDRTPGPGTYYA